MKETLTLAAAAVVTFAVLGGIFVYVILTAEPYAGEC